MEVSVFERLEKCDIAFLKASLSFKFSLKLCPIEALPCIENEDIVKCYSVECESFMYDSDETHLMVTAYDYQKLRSKSEHFFNVLNSGQEHGSSGGPVVNDKGEVVGMIISGRTIVPSADITKSILDLVNTAAASEDAMDDGEDSEYEKRFKGTSDLITEVGIHNAKVTCIMPATAVKNIFQVLGTV